MPTVTVNNTAQHWTSGPQSTPRMILIHTTEGMGWPGYNGGASAPHATIRPIPGVGIEVREHYADGQYSKSLRNASGGVETNRSGVLQYELMGTCDPSQRGRMYFWPDADDTVLRALAQYLAPKAKKYGIPNQTREFMAYPASYGNSRVRMSFAQWQDFRGWCGHQHAPENDHGDPGSFPIRTLLGYVYGGDLGSSEKADPAERKTWRSKRLMVHGQWTSGTIKRLQAEVNTAITGKWDTATKAAVQRWLGVTADGIVGPVTIKALQKKVGMKQTGKWTPFLVGKVQTWLNANRPKS